MKKISRPAIALIALFCVASPAFSADKKRKVPPAAPEADQGAVSAIKPFDKNNNFEIDPEEFPAIQAAFNANPNGKLKKFDKGGDNKLDDTVDRAAINMELAAAKMADRVDSSPRKKKKKK